MVNTDFFSLDIIPKMMEFDVEMFRSRSILVDFGHFQGPAIVLEYTTVYTGLLGYPRFFISVNSIITGIASMSA
jgi:hypothetical protein